MAARSAKLPQRITNARGSGLVSSRAPYSAVNSAMHSTSILANAACDSLLRVRQHFGVFIQFQSVSACSDARGRARVLQRLQRFDDERDAGEEHGADDEDGQRECLARVLRREGSARDAEC